jgi:hypothetical protein
MTKRQRKRHAAPDATLPAAPTPDELVAFPELALLAALEQLLDLTTIALIAAHPVDIVECSHFRPLDLRGALADQIIDLGACLARTTTYYRVAAIDSLYVPRH